LIILGAVVIAAGNEENETKPSCEGWTPATADTDPRLLWPTSLTCREP